MKPNAILENIEREKDNLNLQVRLKKDLSNFLCRLLIKKVGKPSMTIGYLAKFCEENSQIPEEIRKEEVETQLIMSMLRYLLKKHQFL